MKRNRVDIEAARRLLAYDPGTGVFRWRVGFGRHESARQFHIAGGVNKAGYRSIKVGGVRHTGGRLAWAMHYGEQPPLIVDHINGQRDDNRIANLRAATPAENVMNRATPKNNTTGHKGIRRRANGNWTATIQVFGKRRGLGTFERKEDAIKAYRDAEVRLGAEFASHLSRAADKMTPHHLR